MEIISRSDAKKAGLRHYFTGKPCVHGHVTLRLVASGTCQECHRLRSRENFRRDPERQRAANRESSWKRLYGVSRSHVVRYALAPEGCQICGATEVELVPDHCHKTNMFRGWLCKKHNAALGMFGDGRELLEAALKYLQHFEEIEKPYQEAMAEIDSPEVTAGLEREVRTLYFNALRSQ